jgi:hypothetical protein
MEPFYFVIAILGCGEGDAPCQTVRTLDARYESRAACTAATEAAATANAGVDYPVVVAQCVAAGTPPERITPGQILLPPAPRRASQPPMKARRG